MHAHDWINKGYKDWIMKLEMRLHVIKTEKQGYKNVNKLSIDVKNKQTNVIFA